MILRSIYTFSCSQIRDLIIASDDQDTRRGLLKILDHFTGDKADTFVYTICEKDMQRLRAMPEVEVDEQ